MSVRSYRDDARRLRALAVQAADEDKREILMGIASLCDYLASRPRPRENEPINPKRELACSSNSVAGTMLLPRHQADSRPETAAKAENQEDGDAP